MFKRLLIHAYKIVPLSIKTRLGRSKLLKPMRDLLLRPNSKYLESSAKIVTSFKNYSVEFWFYSTLKNIAKAQKSGIERTLLLNTISLINSIKKNNDDCCVLDIGANFGYLSLVWANTISKNNGRCIAFEPNPRVFRTFVKSIKKNCLENVIEPLNCMVGSEDKKALLYLSETSSNILNTDVTTKTIEMEMITIDQYFKKNNLSKCDLIKIDVDGIELDILKGALNTIKKYKPILVVETNENNLIIDFLNKNQYRILDMNLRPLEINSVIPVNIFGIPK